MSHVPEKNTLAVFKGILLVLKSINQLTSHALVISPINNCYSKSWLQNEILVSYWNLEVKCAYYMSTQKKAKILWNPTMKFHLFTTQHAVAQFRWNCQTL